MITIVDYGSGNLRSVSKALDHLGVTNQVSADPAQVERADRLILPGVGAFGACVAGVRDGGFEEPIKSFIASDKPFLGICVGLQILLETSLESPEASGLGVIRGGVPKFELGLKVPHMGWNNVRVNGGGASLFKGIPDESYFYFVHSFYVDPAGDDASNVVGTSEYGHPFAAAIERENLFATQFHPEKSQKWGLKLLDNFSKI